MATLPDRDPREIRVSDLDRDNTTEVLRAAAGEGRLGMEEFQERLDQVYAAKTYADLELVTRDLPDIAPSVVRAPAPRGRVGRVVVAFMGGFKRAGVWRAPDAMTAVAFWGGGKIDLREAVFSGREITIRAFAIMGGIEVVVAEDADVEVTGIGLMGGFDHQASGVGAANSPRITVKGLAFWGGVDVKRKRRKKK